jgi:hypothetical protein
MPPPKSASPGCLLTQAQYEHSQRTSMNAAIVLVRAVAVSAARTRPAKRHWIQLLWTEFRNKLTSTLHGACLMPLMREEIVAKSLCLS